MTSSRSTSLVVVASVGISPPLAAREYDPTMSARWSIILGAWLTAAAAQAEEVRVIDAGVETVSIIGDQVLPWDAGVAACEQATTAWVLGAPVPMAVLFHFEVDSLPPGTQVQGVTLELDAFAGLDPVSLYAVRRPWTAGVTWLEASPGVPWSAPGALAPADSDPQPFATSPLTSRIAFGDAGVALVQEWVSVPAMNFGFVMRSASTRMYDAFRTNSFTTPTSRPGLTVRGVLPDGGALDAGFALGRLPSPAFTGSLACQMAGGPAPSTVNWREFLLRVRVDSKVLMLADLSSIPPWATPTAARWRVSVRNPAPGTLAELREVRRAWVPTDATWKRPASGESWGAAGLLRGMDTEVVPVAQADLSSPFEPRFDDAGLALVERWIARPGTNHGVLLESTSANQAIAANLLPARLAPGAPPVFIIEYVEGALGGATLDLDGGPAPLVPVRKRLDGSPLPGGVGPLTIEVQARGPLVFHLEDGGTSTRALSVFAPGSSSASPVSVDSLDGGSGFLFLDGGLAWRQALVEVRVAGRAPEPPDAGPGDAGGAVPGDGGALEPEDAGLKDAGVTDGGTPDAGELEGGRADGGTGDGGASDEPGGEAGLDEARYQVGCGCTALDLNAALALAVLSLRARRRTRARA